MKSIFKALFCAVIVDFFYFSSVFSFTKGVNSKLILSVLGLATFVIKSAHAREMKVSRQMIILTLLAMGVSLVSYFSMMYNNSRDDSYVSYVISMLVWLAAAYMVSIILNFSYGKVSISLISNFIIAISVFQCAISILGNMFVPVNNVIKYLTPGVGWLDAVDRMYGIGDTTTLDTGGIRYSIACILCAHMLVKTQNNRKLLIPWYIFAYVFITIIGNMVARTTTVGSVIALVYILAYLFFPDAKKRVVKIWSFWWLLVVIAIMFSISAWLYNTDEKMHEHFRFGFEGFFSMVEERTWNVSSNNVLRSMYVYPDNPKTWIIGDGYFNNPSRDPNYIGEITHGYYKHTDVGYLRFIFYIGIIGLCIFSLMILYAGYFCCLRNPDDIILFLLLVLTHFIVWLKVATDCFFILGCFIALSYVRDYQHGENESPIVAT